MKKPAIPELARFVRQYTVLLTTYKKDGTGIGTPVNLAVDGDHAYFRTYGRAWKVRRMRREARVEIAPCTFRGAPTGAAVGARVRLLDPGGEEDRHAKRLLVRKHPVVHGVLVPLVHRLVKRDRTLQYELRLTGPDEAHGGEGPPVSGAPGADG
ncbi:MULTISPECIES: PPOX class F420-dependent oxidoreductase [Streptomyces]|uniref:Putative pyridoxamine 5'-phosphate oxidase-related protein n=1 Tax=Streptomyces albus (strain ATCC 21838 / DSM 41398 / FERM P-419 / JCM 4703 / NBRC 107858) TaxID=1081613 RepID=A0A0B5EPE7_STRA4|nr:PPOX class F420-dependent oxidoreductase [Streptomyces sp. SCSIO ZS0520]AJE84648.1 putative pyridoxamine 5'-phosphate oxidase-related protein [Streptomyces albus]AOU78956.1 putative pyridoxamine 5'-phosphate oxidase-related protein [Streptomyces albus]AYN34691.1 PPOX class F420-dependent oxidoreductase [Streptomyces albus]